MHNVRQIGCAKKRGNTLDFNAANAYMLAWPFKRINLNYCYQVQKAHNIA